jgi:hypothetical protein
MKIMDKIQIRKKAQIMIFMMIIMFTLSIAIMVMLNFINGAISFYNRQINYRRKAYAAESGIQYILNYIKHNRHDQISFGEIPPYVYVYGDEENEEIILGGIELELKIYDPQYVDDALPENRKRPWEDGYTPVINTSFTPEPADDSDVRSIIYYAICSTKTGKYDVIIKATIRKKIYSYILEPDDSGEGTINFRRYREAKVLEIDY